MTETLVNAYATVAQLRVHMKDEKATADETMLVRALNSASRQVDERCGRRFWLDESVTTRLYRPEELDIAWVDDIGSTSGLVIETDEDDDGVFETTWSATDYELEPNNADSAGASGYAWWRIVAVDTRQFPTWCRRRSLRVTARHGWSAVPPGVEEATLIRAYALYKRRESFNGYAGMTDFGPARTVKDDVDFVALLAPYSRMRIGAV